jgi:hypothetical protein
MDWYVSDDNLRRTVRGGWKKLNMGDRPHAVSGMPMLIIHTCHAVLALTRRFQNGICESHTAALCKSNGKDTF